MSSTSRLAKEAIKQSLFLYRRIWKCHNICLAGEAKTFGNQYIKEEFRLHIDRADPQQFNKFLDSWKQYVHYMENSGMKRVEKSKDMKTKEMPKELEEKLSEEQHKVMKAFKEAIYALKNLQKEQLKKVIEENPPKSNTKN